MPTSSAPSNSLPISKPQPPGFLPYLHNFRGIAILYIVAFHCWSSLGWGDHSLEKTVWNSLVVYGTVLFVFIAGFLFQYLSGGASRKFNFGTYLKKK